MDRLDNNLGAILSSYTTSSVRRALMGEFLPTIVLIAATWTMAAQCFTNHQIGSAIWLVPGTILSSLLGLFLVRAFVIMHDAGHNSLSPSKALNRFIGHACSLMVLTPVLRWSKLHWFHHCSSGNLDQQDGLGDIYSMTVTQYKSLTNTQRLLYRFFRNPFIMLCVMPLTVFVLLQRFPQQKFQWAGIQRSVQLGEALEMVALNLFYVVVIYFSITNWSIAGPWAISYAVALTITFTVGVLLFYTQHQFENTYYARSDSWKFYDSCVRGSMTLRLRYRWMDWLIGYINYHSVHHLRPSIPMYHLRIAHDAVTNSGVEIPECTIGDLWATFSCKLWDEDQQKMIGFSDISVDM